MAAMYGADVAQLRALATQFDRSADRLDADRISVGNAIQISAWAGPVAVRFRAQWDSDHSRRVHETALRLRDAASALRANADQQERTSAVGQGAASGLRSVRPGIAQFLPQPLPKGVTWADLLGFILQDAVIDGSSWVSEHVDISGLVVEYITGKKFDAWEVLPGGSYISSVVKGIGLGDAAARFAAAVQNRDWSGGILAAADGAATFVPNPVSLLWGGLSGMTGFFIPLDEATRDEHFAWMDSRGYTAAEISERYSGVQGFINLGNDNVERQAPWLNRAADAALQAPAEWLYNAGIKL